jgi:rare lipoprotein A
MVQEDGSRPEDAGSGLRMRRRHVGIYLGLALSIVLSSASAHAGSHQPASAKNAQNEQRGIASFYGDEHQGQRTASGQRFDERAFTAASLVLPLNSKARVTSVRTGLSVTVTIVDRGPFAKARVIDLSKAAAEEIGITEREGIGLVIIRPLAPTRRRA